MTHRQPSARVVVPTYNERNNLRPLVAAVLEACEDVGVVVVDDNSPDGTGDIADELAAESPRVHVIHRAGKLGLGTAYLAGFEWALAQGAEYVLSMDGDFSHRPSYIPDLLSRTREGYDLVIGSRYVPGGDTPDFPPSRRLLSGGANLLAHWAVGLEARDATAGFRCYRREVLESLPLSGIRSNGYSFLVEMLYLVQDAGYRVAEVPIVFADRKHDVSKISRSEIFKALVTVARLTLRRAVTWAIRGSADD